jgi:uncharacterized membrane protein YfcA
LFVGDDLTLAIAMFVVSVLYASVGQAGGSGYLAVMGFAGMPPEVMRPTALLLNVLVGTTATFWFYRAGLLDFRGLWPFLVGSIPLAILGGTMALPRAIYNPLVGIVLLVSAASLMRARKIQSAAEQHRGAAGSALPALGTGALGGLLAGVTGTGGGFVLSPLLLMLGWASARRMAAATSVLILANSAAALLGNVATIGSLPGALPLWSAAVLIGGVCGAELGSRWLAPRVLIRTLVLLQIVGGLKLLLWP